MKIIVPHFILTSEAVLQNQSIAFNKTIEKIAPLDELIALYPDADIERLSENSLIMAGLINSHVHLEFSANKTSLKYGDFLPWLYSVIENREELVGGCDATCMKKAVDSMLESGTTTFGAISSYGLDLEVCAEAKQNVIYFNELIGSQATMADMLFGDFTSRLNSSKLISRDGFRPAVAIHSPYSVHPILIKKALKIVKDEKLPLTAHFMESIAEKEWCENSQGDFKEFFNKLLKQDSKVSDSSEFLENFNKTDALFTHATQATDDDLSKISKNRQSIIHCPISNRLLGSKPLDLENLEKKNIRWVLATDGLSSNYSLNLFEEMKVALFTHSNIEINKLANELIRSVTINASDALGLNKGDIRERKDADFIIVDLEEAPTKDLALHLILQNYNISKVFIAGERVK